MFFAGFDPTGQWLKTVWHDPYVRPHAVLALKNFRSIVISTGVNIVIVNVIQFMTGAHSSMADLVGPVAIANIAMATIISLISNAPADITTVVRYYFAGFLGGTFAILVIGQAFSPPPTIAQVTEAMPAVVIMITFLFYVFSLIRTIATSEKA